MQPSPTELRTGLSSWLAARRKTILADWRACVAADAQLTSSSSLPRAQFNDHVPDILRAFEWELRRGLPADGDGNEDAAAHGLQRWQQGYRLREVMREWAHLHQVLLQELAAFAASRPDATPAALHEAYRALAELIGTGVSESATQYVELQQVEAEGQVRDFARALEDIRRLERERGELWRQAAHDLRGNLGAVANATAGLTLKGLPEDVRDEFFRLLQRSMASVQKMLDDVMTLARLQAGHETRVVEAFDAAAMLHELCDAFRPQAIERGLFLDAAGPAPLVVEGDAVKLRRIAQNLLLNALKYTGRGGVTVEWRDARAADPERWLLSVCDTGPGYHAGPGAPIAAALEEATQESKGIDAGGETAPGVVHDQQSAPAAARRDDRPVHQERGEGIGLSIVKRLCDLLDATIEVESTPGVGTVFRVLVPRSYSSGT